IFPTATPSPTPIPGAWIKLKDTSFYSFKSLTNLIPAPASSYDSDDNSASHFIIASPLSDPGLVSAQVLAFGSGSASSRNWRNTAFSNPVQLSPSSFIASLQARSLLQPLSSLPPITQTNLNRRTVLLSVNLTVEI
ncbi:MAG: hypothetical protein N2049_05440, partial [Anaerolineales bacterium]|nr:hypothetical protein [Anaerolineales bacterium]